MALTGWFAADPPITLVIAEPVLTGIAPDGPELSTALPGPPAPEAATRAASSASSGSICRTWIVGLSHRGATDGVGGGGAAGSRAVGASASGWAGWLPDRWRGGTAVGRCCACGVGCSSAGIPAGGRCDPDGCCAARWRGGTGCVVLGGTDAADAAGVEVAGDRVGAGNVEGTEGWDGVRGGGTGAADVDARRAWDSGGASRAEDVGVACVGAG